MDNVIFRTSLLRGPKGDRGETGAPDSVPKDGVIAYDGDDLPEGYVEIEELDVYGDLMNEMASLDARLDIVESLPEGSTTMDAELVDIRYGANGKTYQTAGKAVRGQIDEVNENMEWYQEKDKTLIDNATLTGQASGEVATFDMGGDAPLKECVIQIEPKQDLHGLPYPYPAGAGYNKLNYDDWKQSTVANGTGTWENNGVTLTATNNDCFTYSANYANGEVSVSEGDVVKLSWEESTNASGTIYAFDQNGSVIGVANNDSSKSLSVTIGSGITKFRYRFGVDASGVTISYKNVMVQVNTSESTFAPWENICPIGGYYQAEVDDVGKNRVDISETTISSSDYVFNLTNLNIPQGTYTFSFDCTEDGNASFAGGDDNTDFVNDPILVRGGKGAITFIVTNMITQMRLYGYAATYSNFQLEEGSIATTYEPYNGKTTPVPFSNKNLLPSHLKFDSFDIWSGAQALKEINPSDSNKHWFGDEYVVGGCYIVIETEEDKDTIKEIRISRSEADPGNNLSFKLYDKIAAQAYDFGQSVDLTVGGAELSDNLYLMVYTFDEEYTHETKFNSGDLVQLPDYPMYMTSIVIMGEWSGEITIKPMISPHKDTDKTFMPYYNGLQFSGERVYKGYVDPVNMRLTVTHGIVDLGDLSWNYWPQYERFEAHLSNVNKTMYTTDDMLCSCFKPDYSPIAASGIDGTIAIYSDGTLLIICKEYTDASAFKTAMTGQTVCYELATPENYGITQTELKSLLGVNNISADTGEIAVTFRRDANLVINNLIARIEALEGGNA